MNKLRESYRRRRDSVRRSSYVDDSTAPWLRFQILKHSRFAEEVGAARTEEERPKISARQGKHNIMVVPGGQKTTAVSSSGSSITVGISSRLQQLVDSIAADQALNSQQLGSKTRPLRPPVQAGQQAKTQPQNPPVPSLATVTSVTTSTTPKPSLNLPTQNLLQLVGSTAPPL